MLIAAVAKEIKGLLTIWKPNDIIVNSSITKIIVGEKDITSPIHYKLSKTISAIRVRTDLTEPL
jgi:hypothetical protein